MWKLTIRTSKEKVIEYDPKPGITSLGRIKENDIILHDDAVSRHHAEIEFNLQNGTLVIRDLSSTNGTFVNGRRIDRSFQLEHGDQVRIGKCLITAKLVETQRLEREQNVLSLTPELSKALLVESIENFGLLLNDLSIRLIDVGEKSEALEIISEFTRNMVDATVCQIFLKDEFEELAQKGIPPSISQTIVKEKTPILISNIQADKKLTKSTSVAPL